MKNLLSILKTPIGILLLAFGILHFFNEYAAFIKPVFLLLASFGFFISIFGRYVSINKVDLFFVILICTVTAQIFLFRQNDYLSIIFLLSIYFLYSFFIYFIQNANIKKQQSLLLLIYSIIILSEAVLFFFQKDFSITFYPNASIFSILFASQIAFIIPLMLIRSKTNIYKAVSGVVLMIGLFILIKTNGRAGWIGLVSALFFIQDLISSKF